MQCYATIIAFATSLLGIPPGGMIVVAMATLVAMIGIWLDGQVMTYVL